MKALSRLVETAGLPEVETLLQQFGATRGGPYAPWVVPRAKHRSLFAFLTSNGFVFTSSGQAKSESLGVVVNIKALGGHIGITPLVVAKAYAELKPEQVLDALKGSLTSVLGNLKAVPMRVPGKFEALTYLGSAGKLNGVAKALKALDFSVIKLDNQRITTGVRVEVNGTVTYAQYLATIGLLVISSNTGVLDV